MTHADVVDEQGAAARIEAGEWVDCYICSAVYRRRRQTMRYCKLCDRGFCEGEHGTFQGRGIGYCLRCASEGTFER